MSTDRLDAGTGKSVPAGEVTDVNVVLSQVRYTKERDFPTAFGEGTAEEHGHEKCLDAATDFFEGRKVAGLLQWLAFVLGFIYLVRGVTAGRVTDS
ncbi:MAG TPA: hypothetical protein VE522_05750 [Actinomycetota bacterium]|nr:hypothetical protein [Actinomycetota bacterium]